jgi:DNA helicase-2/ATP-dependent DNA helicase PcrA
MAAVTSEATPLCILASAGAGKTRVLTRRIAYRVAVGSASAQHTLALTFTRKAAGELQDRLSKLGLRERPAAGTFHSLASAQLQRWWSDRRQTPPALLERKGRLLGPLAGSRPGLANVPLAELAGHIEWAKARLITPALFEVAVRDQGRRLPPGVSAGAVAGLYARYEDEKVRRQLIDFDDILATCAEAIESDPTFASAQRWRWRHVYVDEFQDLNPLQHRLLLAWLGTSTDLCVVGDPNQAIYGWNGADPSLLTDIPRRWPSTEVIRLDANHRCSPQIVECAAAVLGEEGDLLHSAGPEGPEPDIRAYPSEAAEANGIVAAIRRAHAEGRSWRSMAVLARTNAQLVPIQKALTAAAVPVWSPSQSALLDDPVARRALADLKTVSTRPVQVVVADFEEMLTESQVHSSFEEFDDGSRAVLSVLADLARTFAAQEPTGTAGRFLGWLPAALGDGTDSRGQADQVTLCSFHRAKGLEWSEVWVAGLEQGLVPIGRSTSAEDLAEERRLLYVALTRASTHLHCSWAATRTFGSHPVKREPSPWLDLMQARVSPTGSTAPDGSGEASPSWRADLAEQRRRLRVAVEERSRSTRARLAPGGPPADPELIRTIRAWRLETARASGLPAYVILHDATVEALASLRPHTTEQLLAVPGLGPVKASRYGPVLLSMVADQAKSA